MAEDEHGASDETASGPGGDDLRRAEARLAGLLAIATDAIISVDEAQCVTLFNHGAEATFGYAAAEMLGRPLEVLLPERFRPSHATHVAAFGRLGNASRRMGERREIFGQRKNGEVFPAEASISVLGDAGARTFTVVLRDVTQRKQVEALLEQSNRQLEARVAERTSELQAEMARREETQAALSRAQRMEAFGQLAGGIAHDFNNLLTVITGNQELLEMRLQDPKALLLLKRAQEAAEMGARLTRRLLTFARRRRLEPSVLNLNDQVAGVVELLRRSIGDDVVLTTNLSAGLWNVRADPSEIENALINLAINARDAMVHGGTIVIETASCSVEAGEIGGESKLPTGDYVRLSVSDTGCGMPADVAAHAFEPFYTTKPAGKGTGLGLSTIYGFADQSGGVATIDSREGEGTTVSIYLPRDRSGITGGRTAQEAVRPGGNGEVVLVVEDRADVRASGAGPARAARLPGDRGRQRPRGHRRDVRASPPGSRSCSAISRCPAACRATTSRRGWRPIARPSSCC